jgi:hypothetical protein
VLRRANGEYLLPSVAHILVRSHIVPLAGLCRTLGSPMRHVASVFLIRTPLPLIAIAGALRTGLWRSIDTLGRYGGDQFAAILPGTDAAAAEVVAERMCQEVNRLHFENRATVTGSATVSIGISAGLPSKDPTPAFLLNAADAALYEAKGTGHLCWLPRSQAPEDKSVSTAAT